MSTESVAARLIELCKQGKLAEAQDELYADNAVSVEPEGSPWPSVEGRAALAQKVAQWYEMIEELHNLGVSEPQFAGPFFSVKMTFDMTLKNGVHQKGEQIAVYEVQGGKVVREHFFYPLPS